MSGIVLDVGPIHALTIEVHDTQGSPVPGLDVSARQSRDDLVQLHRCISDINGRCLMPTLSAYSTITFTAEGARKAQTTLITDRQGRFAAHLPAGRYLAAVFPTSDFLDALVGVFPKAASQEVEVIAGQSIAGFDLVTELTLETIQGTIADDSGSIVPGALVSYAIEHERHDAFDIRTHQVTISDKRGHFNLSGLPSSQS